MGSQIKNLAKVIILTMVLASLMGVTSCSNGRCNEARAEEDRLSKEIDSLTVQFNRKSDELNQFIKVACEALASGDTTLLRSTDKAWCLYWKETGNIPPIGGPERQKLSQEEDNLFENIVMTQKRRAITITSFENCFSPTLVIDAHATLGD